MSRVTLRTALIRVTREWDTAVRLGRLKAQTAESYIKVGERLLRFTVALGITRLDDITDTVAQTFVDAPEHDRQRRLITTPADSTRRVRKSGVDALFAEARHLGLTTKAPLLDLPPIPRSAPRPVGALTDRDIEELRFHAERGMPQTRHATILGLLLSGLHSGEIGYATISDLDLQHARVWACGTPRTAARYCSLDDWSIGVLRLRADFIVKHSSADGCGTLATIADSPAYRRQASVCAAFGEIVRSGGIVAEGRSAAPCDVSSWLAVKIFEQTGQIADVALRFGLSSLDGAARLAGYQWQPSAAGADT
ncbi:hypothetical protein IPZ58_26645 [Streptomyces roseoverticillatus]|uniref:hypothetical protein n=1 Tax=Streptomyces roseoverticillatus TaxID=66429 RepID=UPI001F22753B|nr:hypothetical protein [Streptomyces roseoverticillatus]MCF3105143.1 hypothetical protein [Streptomyces roseoverticillatus]